MADIKNTVGSKGPSMASDAVHKVEHKLEGAKQAAGDGAEQVGNKAGGMFSGVKDTLSSVAQKVAHSAETAEGMVKSGVKSGVSKVKNTKPSTKKKVYWGSGLAGLLTIAIVIIVRVVDKRTVETKLSEAADETEKAAKNVKGKAKSTAADVMGSVKKILRVRNRN